MSSLVPTANFNPKIDLIPASNNNYSKKLSLTTYTNHNNNLVTLASPDYKHQNVKSTLDTCNTNNNNDYHKSFKNNNNNSIQTQHQSDNTTPSAKVDDNEVTVVLITGCGSKIGCNIAVGFARLGLRVALSDSDIKHVELVASKCEAVSPKKILKPLQIVADISQLDQAHKVIDKTIEQFGRLDVLVNTVNNECLMQAVKFGSNSGDDDDPHVFEQYHKIIANTMHAVTYLCISAAPYLRKTKGSIVNVSQVTQNESGSYKFAYCMSKAGIATLTRCLATDLAPDIKVICANPKSDSIVQEQEEEHIDAPVECDQHLQNVIDDAHDHVDHHNHDGHTSTIHQQEVPQSIK